MRGTPIQRALLGASAAAAAALTLLGAPAQASTRAYSQSWVKGEIYPGASQTIDDPSLTGPSVAQTYADALSDKPGWPIGLAVHADGATYARYGVLKVNGNVSGAGLSEALNRGEAHFADTIMLSAPGRDGQLGSFTATMSLEWSFSGSFDDADCCSSFIFIAPKLQLDVGTFGHVTVSSFQTQEAYYYGDSSRNVLYSYGLSNGEAAPFSTTVSVTVPFRFGTAFGFEAALTGTVHGYSLNWLPTNYAGGLVADHSAYWTGTTVTVDGAPLTDYSIASSSGTDWRQSFLPVPEPQTYALLLLGLAGLALAAKRRQR